MTDPEVSLPDEAPVENPSFFKRPLAKIKKLGAVIVMAFSGETEPQVADSPTDGISPGI